MAIWQRHKNAISLSIENEQWDKLIIDSSKPGKVIDKILSNHIQKIYYIGGLKFQGEWCI